MRVRVGTSGYAYKEWKGPFYPDDLKPPDMLGYYAGRLDTVEINNTFYRMPSESVLRGWAGQTPDGFSFAIKASRRITHQKQLREAGEPLGHLVRAAAVLADKLGPLLFQLPPHLRRDVERLRAFLALLPTGLRPAFEFRHESWIDDAVHDALRQHGAALVAADKDGAEPAPIVPTARFGYLRLRRQDYDDRALGAWAERVAAQPWDRAWVFFKHEDEGAAPRLAAEFARRTRDLAD